MQVTDDTAAMIVSNMRLLIFTIYITFVTRSAKLLKNALIELF